MWVLHNQATEWFNQSTVSHICTSMQKTAQYGAIIESVENLSIQGKSNKRHLSQGYFLFNFYSCSIFTTLHKMFGKPPEKRWTPSSHSNILSSSYSNSFVMYWYIYFYWWIGEWKWLFCDPSVNESGNLFRSRCS